MVAAFRPPIRKTCTKPVPRKTAMAKIKVENPVVDLGMESRDALTSVRQGRP
jgi:hypothetical protein